MFWSEVLGKSVHVYLVDVLMIIHVCSRDVRCLGKMGGCHLSVVVIITH